MFKSYHSFYSLSPCYYFFTSSSPPLTSCPGIPTLILLDAEGHMITRQGRVEVLNDPECRLFPWHPRPVLELSESNAVQLHEGPCLVLFVGKWNLFCSLQRPTLALPRTNVAREMGRLLNPLDKSNVSVLQGAQISVCQGEEKLGR